MKRWVIVSALLCALFGPASAFWQSRDSNYNIAISGGAAYVGPGDLTLTGTTVAWGGFSCWKASAPTAPAVRLINETTTTQADINCNTSTGIDLSAVSTLGCGSAVCKIVTIYDQTGINNCTGGTAACNLTQATDANRPTYTATGGAGGKACANWTATTITIASPATQSLAQPVSFSTISTRTGSTLEGVLTTQSSLVGIYYSSTADNVQLFGGSLTANVSATSASFHALSGVVNGSSSIIGVDGSSTSSLVAGSTGPGVANITMGDPTNPWTGIACEFWVVSGAWTTGNISSISSNAHTRYGF